MLLIDLKGSSGNIEDSKVNEHDIKSLETLQNLYGPNAKALFVFLWLKGTSLEEDLFKQGFKTGRKSCFLSGKEKVIEWPNACGCFVLGQVYIKECLFTVF